MSRERSPPPGRSKDNANMAEDRWHLPGREIGVIKMRHIWRNISGMTVGDYIKVMQEPEGQLEHLRFEFALPVMAKYLL